MVNGIKLYISAAEKLIHGARERLRKAGLRREIVKLHAEINLGCGADGAGGGINGGAVHITEPDSGKFSEGTGCQINSGNFAGNKWISQCRVTQHCLLRHAIISETRVPPGVEIGIGNFNDRSEGIRGDVRTKHGWPKIAAHIQRPDGISRTALVAAYEVDEMISPHRWRPSAGHLV